MSRKKRNRNVFYPDEFGMPNSVNGGSTSTWFYEKRLMEIVKSRLIFENLPKTWNVDYLLSHIFKQGHLAMINLRGSTYCVESGYSGINLYNMPLNVNIANVILGNHTMKLGVDAELLYFNYDGFNFTTLTPIVRMFAEKLASCDCSIDVNLQNSRISHIFETNNDAEEATLKRMYDDISHGTPAVFLRKGNTELSESKVFTTNVKQNYIANDILLTKNQIMNDFYTFIGINNSNTDKKERLIQSEVNSNNEAIKTVFEMYIDTLNECLTRFNAISNLNVIVKERRIDPCLTKELDS